MKKRWLQVINRLKEIEKLKEIERLKEIKLVQQIKLLQRKGKLRDIKKIQNSKRGRKFKIVEKIIVISSFIFIFTGCSTQKNDDLFLLTEPYTVTQEKEEQWKEENQEQQKEKSQEDKKLEILSGSINPFAFDLLEELTKKDETVFFSPYSISMALSMATNGAKSETKEELLTMLKITDLEEWNKQTGYFLNQEVKQDITLSTANSIWLQKGLKLADGASDLFLKPVSKYYQAEVIQADFADKKTVELINNWASKNTDGMIKNLLDKTESDTLMILLNAVYFEGKWETKFKKKETQKETFYGAQKEQTAQMMHLNGESFKYYTAYGLKAIQLPYKNGKVVMNLILPQEKTAAITEVIQNLTQEEKLNFLKGLNQAKESEISVLALPKFELEYGTIGLKEILKKLGMEQAFNSYLADFSVIDKNIYLEEVYHRAKIEVDEDGSRAAAATAVIGNERSVKPMPREIKEFIADRPFLFMIQDVESEIILFMGLLSDIQE